MIYQLHHTSAAISGTPGWHVTARTPGLGGKVTQEIVRLLTAELAVDARRTRPPPVTEQPARADGDSGPSRGDGNPGWTTGATLSYSLLRNGAALICRTVDAGRDFAGRPGNAFQHALLIAGGPDELAGLLPAELWWWPGWDDGSRHGELPPVEALDVDRSLPRQAAIDRARELHRHGRLAPVLASVRRAALTGHDSRIVLVESEPATTIRTILVATGSLPREVALAMTFSVQVGQPDQSPHVLVGTPPGTGIDRAAVPFGVTFETHDLDPSTMRPAAPGAGPADGDLWAAVAAQLWAAGRPEIIAGAGRWFAEADAARRLADEAVTAGAQLAAPVPVPDAVIGDEPPAASGPVTARPSRRTGPSARGTGGTLGRWASSLHTAGSVSSRFARGGLLFAAGALVAFGTVSVRLLALPVRLLSASHGGPPVVWPAGGEVAYPAYFASSGQARADLAAIRDAVLDEARAALPALASAWPSRWAGSPAPSETVRPGRQMWAAGTALGVATAGRLARAVLATHAELVVVVAGTLRAAGTALRLAGSIWRLARGVRVDCPYPDCARPLSRPFYECPNENCRRRHDELRPGRGGLLFRVCACGTRLRTWSPGRRGRLATFCGSCEGRLPDGIGHLPIVHIALIGPPASGKTTLLVAALAGLRDLAFQGDLEVTFPFGSDEDWYQRSERVLAGGGWLESTPTPNPRALVVLVGIPHGPRRVVFFFDPDGALYTDRETLRTTHRYLERTRNALLVIDPSAQPALLTRLNGAQREEAVEAAHPAAEPTYDTMRRLIRVLRSDRSLPRRGGRIALRLAMVVSKSDWLRGLPPDLRLPRLAAAEHDAPVRDWLARPARMPELVLHPAKEFTETRYWALSAADSLRGRRGQPDPEARAAAAEPVLWLLAGNARGFRHLAARRSAPPQAGQHAAPRAPGARR